MVEFSDENAEHFANNNKEILQYAYCKVNKIIQVENICPQPLTTEYDFATISGNGYLKKALNRSTAMVLACQNISKAFEIF